MFRVLWTLHGKLATKQQHAHRTNFKQHSLEHIHPPSFFTTHPLLHSLAAGVGPPFAASNQRLCSCARLLLPLRALRRLTHNIHSLFRSHSLTHPSLTHHSHTHLFNTLSHLLNSYIRSLTHRSHAHPSLTNSPITHTLTLYKHTLSPTSTFLFARSCPTFQLFSLVIRMAGLLNNEEEDAVYKVSCG